MSILDKTFTGIKKVIKCLILSCFYVNILYVSVVLAKPPHEYLSNAFKSVLKNFEENPRMLIPGGSILLIDYDKSKSISQDTEPIEQISQPFVNTPPASATVNVSPNNLLRDSYDNRGTDLSDQNTDYVSSG